MSSRTTSTITLLLLALISPGLSAVPISSLPFSLLKSLNETLGGKLREGQPLALPCFSKYDDSSIDFDESTCTEIQANYTSPDLRAQSFGAFMQVRLLHSKLDVTSMLNIVVYMNQAEWETCQNSSQGCLLDSSHPSDPSAFVGPTCFQGNIAPYYVSCM